MKLIILLSVFFGFNSKLRSQNVVFIEKNGFVYSDTSSTPAINVLTGEVVKSKDIVKDTSNIYKSTNNLPNNMNDLIVNPSNGYIIEPKRK